MRRAVTALLVSTLVAAGAIVAVTTFRPDPENTASATNPITPGNFTGYGFDQCEAPSQAKMTAWRKSSPFRAAGIYISGSLRYCQKQTYLTPTWVSTQLAAGWKLLPIHLGAQASCTTRDRYQKNKISSSSTDDYAKARAQGRSEAKIAVAAAQRLGIVPKSTIYYDLEAFNPKIASCKWSSLWFLAAWTNQLHSLGYVSGVYSSAASGMKVLDDARVTPGNRIALPDQIWIADWNNKADVKSTYIRSDGWPGARIHQYQGGHNEKWGGVTINIDRNYLDLRNQATTPPPVTTPEGSTSYDPKCTTASINRTSYRSPTPTTRPDMIIPMQCLLKQRGFYPGAVSGHWGSKTTKAVAAFQAKVKHPVKKKFTRSDWVAIHSAGSARKTLKPGVRGADVIRAQRALNAATSAKLKVTGIYDAATQRAAAAYQRKNGIKPTEGIIARLTWTSLGKGIW
ncbi:hypothetical protein ABIE44_002200 [Marmoricola sp. OAE513]|uniref:glycoside hydrolase domain-containing protein n=1 Tax=Marmoricola sp. OAE513 TaxID=2817894 RepID=UPI001AE80E15